MSRDRASSESRLWKMIEERCVPGADVAAIDERIWETFGETWAVIFTDLSGFSRQVATFGIIHFLQIIYEQERLFAPIIEREGGTLVKSEADSLLIVFRSPERALACAIAMQHASAAYNAPRVAEEKVLLCVGIGYGRILRIGDTDVYGQEVNAASKLGEDTARAGEILVTQAARDAVPTFDGVTYDPLDVAVPGSTTNFRVRY